jgi:hypothetical protein
MPQRGGLVTTLAVLGALLLTGSPAAQAKSVGFRHVATGTASDGRTAAPPEPVARVVRDAQAARALLSAWRMDRAIASAVAVDFTRRSLVVLLDGRRSDPGYVELVGDVDVTGAQATLTATVFRKPGGHATVLARPWAIVSVPRAAVAQVAPEVGATVRCVAQVRCRPFA